MIDSEMFSAVLTLIFGCVAAGTAYLILPWLKRKASGTASHFDDILLTAIEKPLIITIIAWSVYIALTHFGILPETIAGFGVEQFVNAFFILIGTWIFSSFSYNLLRTYGATLAEKTDTDIDDRVFPMLEIIVKYLIWFAALLLLLDNFEIDITPILAGAGIAGIAIALAAQDVLSNFFGGAIITMDQPFKIGDRIMFETHFGDIISIGPRSTRLKTLDNQIVTIPNSKLTSNIVINYAQPDIKMKVRIPFSVAYGSEISKVKKILLEIAREAAENTSWVIHDPAPSVYFLEFGESSLNGQLIVWTNNYDYSWDVKDFINSRIDEQFKKENIEIPFRQVDLHVRSQGGC